MTDSETIARVIRFPIERRQDRAVVSTSLPMGLCIAFGIACAAAFIASVGYAWICVLFSL